MKRALAIKLISFALGFATTTFAGGDFLYRVKKGDTLSGITKKKFQGRVYGKRGEFKRIVKINPGIKNIHRIYPGQMIHLQLVEEPVVQVAQRIPANEPPVTPEPVVTQTPAVQHEVNAEAPVPAEETKSPSFGEYGLLLISKYRAVTGVDPNGTIGTLSSTLSTGFGLEWSPHIDEATWADFGFRYQPVKFAGSTDRTMQTENQIQKDLYLRLNHRFTPVFKLEFTASAKEEIFYRATDSTHIKVDKEKVNELALGAQYDFMQTTTMSFGLKGQYQLHLPFRESYYISGMGTGYLGAFVAEERVGHISLTGEAFYRKDRFPVEGITFTSQDLGIQFGLKYRLQDR